MTTMTTAIWMMTAAVAARKGKTVAIIWPPKTPSHRKPVAMEPSTPATSKIAAIVPAEADERPTCFVKKYGSQNIRQ
jgi:hypothetical protein